MSCFTKKSPLFPISNILERSGNLLQYLSYAAVSLSLLSFASPIYAMEEQQQLNQPSVTVKTNAGKRKRAESIEVKGESQQGQDHFVKKEEKEKEKEELYLKRTKTEDTPEASDYFNRSSAEVQDAIFRRVIDLGGHDGVISFTRSKLAQDSQFDKLKAIYAPAHSTKTTVLLSFLQNIKFSIPIEKIRNAYLGQPVSFYFSEFVEERCFRNPEVQQYHATDNDVKSLGKALQAINTIEEMTLSFERSDLKSPYFIKLKNLLKDLANCNLTKLNLCGPDGVEGEKLRAYENHFLNELWPVIREIPSLKSLHVFLENEDCINNFVRSIAELDTPLKHLKFGYFNLKGTVADGFSLLISQSSSLKTLELHDINTDLISLKPIITSVKRKATFEKFLVDAPNDHNDYNQEEEEIKEFINGDPKISIWDMED